MCGRMNVSDHPGVQQLVEWLGLDLPEKMFTPSYNVAPSALLWVVAKGEDGNPVLRQMQWGLVPPWAKPGKFSGPLINARAETVWEKPSFKNLMKNRRVIIPANGFYEWRREGKTKTPFYISSDKRALAFGGLCQRSGEHEWQCCVITTSANNAMSQIHDRQPVIIPKESMREWISSEDKLAIDEMMHPVADSQMNIVQVGNFVNNARNDGEQCILPV